MMKTGDLLVRKLHSTYRGNDSDGMQPYLKQLLTNVPPNGCGRVKVMSTYGDSPSETALFKRKRKKLVAVQSMNHVEAGAYVAASPELARLGWHAGGDALNWKYHVWSVGIVEGVKVSRKFGFLGYADTGFLRRLKRAVNLLQGAKAEDVNAIGHYPTSLKFITDLGGKSISRIKSCLHALGKSTDRASDSGAGRLPVKYSFYFDTCREGCDVRANIWLMVASLEPITGKGALELDNAIKSMQNRIGVAIHGLLEYAEVVQVVGILGSTEKKAQPAKAES